MLNQRWFAGAQRLLALITSAVAAFFLATGPALGQAGLPPAPAGVQITSTYGIEFATVSGANNPGIPWDTLHSGLDQAPFQLQGRGSVSHDYRIARSETTTSQWMAFINTFAGRSDYPTQIRDVIGFELRFGPHFWGAAPDPRYNGPGFQYTLDTTSPASGMQPVGGISWRAAAMYCNWLHNGQSSDWSTLLDGAYDVATFGRSAQEPLNYTDAPGHRPDARFWIPTLDEWMKAAYYDPNRAPRPGRLVALRQPQRRPADRRPARHRDDKRRPLRLSEQHPGFLVASAGFIPRSAIRLRPLRHQRRGVGTRRGLLRPKSVRPAEI